MTSFSKWLITSLFAKVVWEKKLLKDFFCSCVASKVFLKSSFLKRLKKFFPRKRKWSFSKRSSIEDRFQFLSKNVLPSSRKMHWKLNLIHEDNKKERSNWILFSEMFLFRAESWRRVLIFLRALADWSAFLVLWEILCWPHERVLRSKFPHFKDRLNFLLRKRRKTFFSSADIELHNKTALLGNLYIGTANLTAILNANWFWKPDSILWFTTVFG